MTCPPAVSLRSGRQVDRLKLLVGDQSLQAELAAETGSLDAAEWRGRVGQVLVDADGAGLNPSRDIGAVIGVGGPDASAEPVIGVVGDPDRILLAVASATCCVLMRVLLRDEC
jgi:hypothetical protein